MMAKVQPLNDTNWEKTAFYSIQYKNGCLAASKIFHMFTKSIQFYTFYYHVLKSMMFEKCDSLNKQ